MPVELRSYVSEEPTPARRAEDVVYVCEPPRPVRPIVRGDERRPRGGTLAATMRCERGQIPRRLSAVLSCLG
jgi:hypothetical protein